MARPNKPTDLYVVNGWYLTLPVPGIGSDGIFETLEGLGKESDTVTVADAGTNRIFKFTNQITEFTDLTLTRTYNGTAADRAMEVLVTSCIENGLQIAATATKLHHGETVFSVLFEGFRFVSTSYPTWDVNAGEKFTVTYTATCHSYTILPAGA